jgi:hypothetical protein
VLVVGGSLYALQWGITGVAWATLIALVVFYALLTVVATRIASLRLAVFVGAHLRACAILALVLACGWSVRAFLPVGVASPPAFLATYLGVLLPVLAILTFRFKERLWGNLLYGLGHQAYVKYLQHRP